VGGATVALRISESGEQREKAPCRLCEEQEVAEIEEKTQKTHTMKILRLPITGDWLNEIDECRKFEEYRDIKQHYISRFFTPVKRDLRDLFEMSLKCTDDIRKEAADFGCMLKDFDAVELIAGYSRTARRSLYELRGITVGRGREEWGAPTDRNVFRLHLGRRIELTTSKS
jgi:hypothetical protein